MLKERGLAGAGHSGSRRGRVCRTGRNTGVQAGARGWTLATAESCTGGWIAKCCTDRAGSSAWFDRGFVSYSNEAKHEMLGVENAVLKDAGAVSREVALQMAAGARSRAGTDIAVAVTGIAGPDGGSADKPVGSVWFAWALEDRAEAELLQFPGDREAVRRFNGTTCPAGTDRPAAAMSTSHRLFFALVPGAGICKSIEQVQSDPAGHRACSKATPVPCNAGLPRYAAAASDSADRVGRLPAFIRALQNCHGLHRAFQPRRRVVVGRQQDSGAADAVSAVAGGGFAGRRDRPRQESLEISYHPLSQNENAATR